MIDEFKAANPGTTYDITLAVVGEPDAKTRYLEDPAAAADVFAFANDQLKDLVAAGALYEITGKYKQEVIKDDGAGSVGAASIGDKLYAFPMTADNGYFMYYDSSVFTPEDVKSLDKMLAAAQKAGKKVFMDLSNDWYIASFSLCAVGNFAIDDNGEQIGDFNNATGIDAGEAIKAF